MSSRQFQLAFAPLAWQFLMPEMGQKTGYLLLTPGSDTVSVINVLTNAVSETLNTCNDPRGITIEQQTARTYIACYKTAISIRWSNP